MLETRYLGKLCPFNKACPVYQGKLVIENRPEYLIKNVFCNRGIKGWKNCERFKLEDDGQSVPVTATPYKKQ